MLESRCAYGILFASYTCPEEFLEMKQCVWFKVSELRALRKDDLKPMRRDAEKLLLSVAGVFQETGAFNIRVSAAAVVLSGTRGYEILP